MINIINGLINGLASGIAVILNLLPSSPFTWDLSGASGLIGFVFWLFPIPEMITLITSYVSAVALYYVVRVVLRWMKVAGE